jgi:hypothetical protein
VEDDLAVRYNSAGFGYLIEEHKREVKMLEDKRRKLLMEKEKRMEANGFRKEMTTPCFFIDM